MSRSYREHVESEAAWGAAFGAEWEAWLDTLNNQQGGEMNCPKCNCPMVCGAPHGPCPVQWECRQCGTIVVPSGGAR